MTQENPQQTSVITISTKSVGIAIILTFLFGPLGMFYSTVGGAIIMSLISIVVGLFTLGFGFFVTWPICIIWGALAASSYNKNLLAGKR